MRRARRGLRELGFIALLYAAYAASRVFADDSLAPARERAEQVVSIEHNLLLDVERGVVGWFAGNDVAGLAAAYYYASAHYLLTALVLGWLYHQRAAIYPRARQTLVVSTLLALASYLLMPTAPPRLVGYADLMALHADSGWWGQAASAPQGMGWLTNQLAAFPSMHAGWALWVALAVSASTPRLLARVLGWSHAIITAVVVVGTGNHWLLDVVVGWGIVFLVWRTTGERVVSERDPGRSASL
ncbi:phosphatase PAP2 family protein [Nocardioides sp.]|uniref:phosphatase PAP2 family protein n=1 Tax=Nocardioides sp. TaxID=35761 RepID=UPI00286D8EA8|nr:phosphatase PAP2 family protein [Nocardioides sp.]